MLEFPNTHTAIIISLIRVNVNYKNIFLEGSRRQKLLGGEKVHYYDFYGRIRI